MKNTERIDRYLLNEMEAEERKAFEKELNSDAALRNELENQKTILQGIEKAGIRGEFVKAVKQHTVKKKLTNTGIVIIVLAAIGSLILVNKTTGKVEMSKVNSVTPHHYSDSGILPGIEQQEFAINNNKDTIIETNGGMVLAIAAHTFKSDKQTLQLIVKEALKPLDIIKAGLSTMSNDSMLETGGMFSIEVYDNGNIVGLNKPIISRVPADSIDQKMMLFRGEKNNSGLINWVDPKPISKALQTTDINSLNFYPPEFIPTLKKLGLDINNKAFTDSLYYAYSGYQPENAKPEIINKSRTYDFLFNNQMEFGNGEVEVYGYKFGNRDDYYKHYHFKSWKDFNRFEDSLRRELKQRRTKTPPSPGRSVNADSTPVIKNEIDPSRIRAIWNKRFNNTLLATKAFEERLQFIFTTCNPRFLQFYINNLDKKLYEIDSMCAASTAGSFKVKFLEFYERKDQGVEIGNQLQRKLNRYFENSFRAYKTASERTWRNFREEEAKLEAIADLRQREQAIKELERTNTIFNQELCINLIDAYRQIGQTRECPQKTPPPSKSYYEVIIPLPGTYNLDKYVTDATINRSSLEYVTETGRKAIITYTPVELIIDQYKSYDRVLVYLLPKGLSSFQRVDKQMGGVFREKLNALLEYDVAVLAFKGYQMFFARRQNIKPGNILFNLKQMPETEIENELNTYSIRKYGDLRSELLFQKSDLKAGSRLLEKIKKQAYEKMIVKSIFPCIQTESREMSESDRLQK